MPVHMASKLRISCPASEVLFQQLQEGEERNSSVLPHLQRMSRIFWQGHSSWSQTTAETENHEKLGSVTRTSGILHGAGICSHTQVRQELLAKALPPVVLPT